jgi:hypothetical protein
MKNGQVGDKLERKLAHAQRVFEDLVVRTPVFKMLSAFSDWAIVGGAVRDVLLADESDCHSTAPIWQDVDIAVAHESPDALVAAFAGTSPHWRVRLNSFGGVKATFPSFGTIDIWVTGTHTPRQDAERYQYWTHYLDTVDFGVNAVAFAWPSCDLIVHQRWVKDVQSNCVEVLSECSPRKEIQPLRAIALCAALTCRHCRPAHLGERVWTEISQLLEAPEHMHAALAYLRSKVASGRWSKDHLLPFLARLVDQPRHSSTDKELQFLECLRGVIKQQRVGQVPSLSAQ